MLESQAVKAVPEEMGATPGAGEGPHEKLPMDAVVKMYR